MRASYSILACFTCFFCFALLSVSFCRSDTAKKPVDHVNPFIGTGGHGHTYPGVSRPFGMVQLSPDTRVEGWDACAGYHYSDSTILGFSHTHLSGTGVADYGDILLMPITGPLRFERGAERGPASGYRSRFRHETEQATAGFYSVLLDDYAIRVELTTSQRVGFHRYTFPRTDTSSIVIDLQHGIGPDQVLDSELSFSSDSEVTGFRRSKGWAENQVVYFVAQFSRPFESFGVALGGRAARSQKSARGKKVKGFVQFRAEEGGQILVKVALSSVSVEGARKNLLAEVPHWDFDRVRSEAREEWNQSLSRIEVEGGSEDERVIFYTSLYHALLNPNLFSDVDGTYRGMDFKTHTTAGYNRYTVFSLWDTFRAEHPLLTILEPKRTVDFIKTFLGQYDERGLLPVWELAANETWCMIGYHAVSVIADAYSKGIRGFDAQKAFRAMKKSAMLDRFGINFCSVNGYIPAEKESESVSKLLEYAYDDWCIAQMAHELGKISDAKEFSRRAQAYRNLYSPSTGFMRARKNGDWLEPFDPYAVTNEYTEANAWQYSFFTPHDVHGLIELMGGKERFIQRLDELFTTSTRLTGRQQADITGLMGQYAHGNEPSHHIAYLYVYAGAPWKTQQRVRDIFESLYTARPDGLSGNEDCGQMSAWYVLSAMGFYQVSPGQPLYTIGSPLFDKVTIQLENGKQFVIRASNNSTENRFIQSASLNGREYRKSYFMHTDLLGGGEVVFEMGSKPNPRWGSLEGETPSSLPSRPIVSVPLIVSRGGTFEDSTIITLNCATEAASIYYTADGSKPTIHSRLYQSPIVLKKSASVRAIAAKLGLPPSLMATAEFKKIKPIGTISLRSAFSPQYTAGGDQALVDHLRGTRNFRTGGWQGYEGNDLDAVIDLGDRRNIKFISTGFLQDINSWIFFPTAVEYSISDDGRSFRTVAELSTGVSARKEGGRIKDVRAMPKGAEARFVRVFAKNIGRCPDWHKGAGNKAWLFVDEIIIE